MTPRSQHQSRNCSNQISQQQEGLPACTPSSKQHPSSGEYVQINAASWNSYLLACVPWWTSLRSWAAPTCTALLLLLWRAARKPWRSPHPTAMVSCGDTRGWQSPSMTGCKAALQGAAAISSQPHLAFHAAGSSFLSASLSQTDLFLFFSSESKSQQMSIFFHGQLRSSPLSIWENTAASPISPSPLQQLHPGIMISCQLWEKHPVSPKPPLRSVPGGPWRARRDKVVCPTLACGPPGCSQSHPEAGTEPSPPQSQLPALMQVLIFTYGKCFFE